MERGVLIFSVLVGVTFLSIALYTKLHPTKTQLAFIAANAPSINTVNSFVDSNGNTHSLILGTDGILRLQFLEDGSSIPQTVWDSVNSKCGPNLSNYNAMVPLLPLDPGITLGVTPQWIAPNGNLVTFRLVLMPGDVRIYSMQDSRFWSILDVSTLPLSWPSTIANGDIILWQTAPLAFNVIAQFTNNGQLQIINPSLGTTLWNATQNGSIVPICV